MCPMVTILAIVETTALKRTFILVGLVWMAALIMVGSGLWSWLTRFIIYTSLALILLTVFLGTFLATILISIADPVASLC